MSEPESKPAPSPKNPELMKHHERLVAAMVKGMNRRFPPKTKK